MWNQIISRPILGHLLRCGKSSSYSSAIKGSSGNQLNLLHVSKSLQHCASLSSSSTPSSTSSPTSAFSKSDEKYGDYLGKQPPERSLNDIMYQVDEIISFLESNNKSKVKTYGLTLFTMISGVFAGAYAAHFGAWFLDKVGLFMFQEDDDD
ncbi:uncharacterized protein LOC107366198 [Tetranychus urticae]|uniref:Uncharacterized protein n=1 Tax=Tetranychus urticae TaxID=32264 RepID=T1KPL6_TETUR|nr:uncharacterized protein LOC107366198 [Tetranychus urticae]